MLTRGDVVGLAIEKPAAGGRMIARHEGQIVLVQGAIPGERVSARVEKAERQLAFAAVVSVDEPSPDRRDPFVDPRCGGCLYAHVAYARQLRLKADVIADAFTRIGRLPLDVEIAVRPSRADGHRMRARLHVRDGRAGFFLEGTHELCDARSTLQLRPESLDAVGAAIDALRGVGATASSVEVSENITGDERAVHVELASGAPSTNDLARVVAAAGLTGCSCRTDRGAIVAAGDPAVSDSVAVLTGEASAPGTLTRSAVSFFQANRYLLPSLVSAVRALVPASGHAADLYAGVGLFAVTLAATGQARVTAVEGDPSSGADLTRNVTQWPGVLEAAIEPVERHLARTGGRYSTVLVDPPRTGASKEAVEAIARHGSERVVYVSCDPPTMARDARRLVDAGYRLSGVQAFDLFPNTPHVEVLGLFER